LLHDLKSIGADGIFRGFAQRHYDFRSGVRLGKNDHCVNWKKPSKPDWMLQEQYDSYPTEMVVREFKVNGNVYVTTFLDAKKYHKQELAKIYGRRWDVEVNLKSIKEIMNMDFLSCKTPEMVRKEIGIHFLAYNFIRIIMAEACEKHNEIPWKISFKGSVQLINSFASQFFNSTKQINKILYSEMLKSMIKNKIGNRPGRVEPRAVKRRPKAFPLLCRARIIEKKKLMRKIEKRILRNSIT
jgi:hypothetical protein